MKSRIPFISLCLLILGITACRRTLESPPNSEKGASIMYIANEGVLLQTAESGILIDAIHQPYRKQYASTPDSIFELMLAKQGPFEQTKLVLLSHVHRDHHSSSQLIKLLTQRPSLQLIAPQQAVDSVLAFREAERLSPQLQGLVNQTPEIIWHQAGLSITSIPIPHTYPQLNSWVQHYAYLIKSDQHSYLHLGDSYAVKKHLEQLEMSLPDTIDVAMVPFWFLYDSAWRWLKEVKHIKHIVAIHVPIPDAKKLEEEMEALDPRIRVLHHLGETKYID
ncbi:MAG: MBL fold metallo-hydrolase [Bacteroidota bacterium]